MKQLRPGTETGGLIPMFLAAERIEQQTAFLAASLKTYWMLCFGSLDCALDAELAELRVKDCADHAFKRPTFMSGGEAMIKFENASVVGWESAVRGMRNPLESWSRSDSSFGTLTELGPNDKALMKKLRDAGTDHRKFLRMVVTYVDITAPVYWMAELDTYKVGTVRNSCSFMHKGASRVFDESMFSWHGLDEEDPEYVSFVIAKANRLRDKYIQTKDPVVFQQLRDAVPQGLNVKSTFMFSYEALANMYKSRKSHRLKEWQEFCSWVESLPESWVVTGE